MVLVGALSAQSPAAIKCWTNRDGVRECGDVIPPEYAQQEHEEKSAGGLLLRKQPRSKTAQEVAAERERRRAEAEAHAKRDDARRKQAAADRVLLQTFGSEDDLGLAREGQLTNIESQIKVTESQLLKLEKSLDQMIGDAADFERRGRKVPPELTDNIREVRDQIASQNNFIAGKRTEQAQIRAKFDRDLARFRELRASRVAAPSGVTPPGDR
jgi:multidrug efflux pump subunit AcrA (membrane-fusion protein)